MAFFSPTPHNEKIWFLYGVTVYTFLNCLYLAQRFKFCMKHKCSCTNFILFVELHAIILLSTLKICHWLPLPNSSW